MHLVLTDHDTAQFKHDISSKIKIDKPTKLCVLHNSYNSETLSLSSYIENHSDELREKYLDFIDSLAYKKLGNKKIVDILKIHNDYSYWFSSSLFEKSIYKQNYTDAIRLIALEQILIKYNVKEISIYIKSKALSKSIKGVCFKLKIAIKNNKPNFALLDLKNTFVYSFAKSLYTFFTISTRYFKYKELDEDMDGILFTGPLSYLDTNVSCKGLKFKSNLWDGIPKLLEKAECKANFLHIYSPHPEINSTSQASNIIDALNKSNYSNHFLLDSNLSLTIKIKIFYYWLKMALKFLIFKNFRSNFDLKSSNVNLFHILKDSYYESFMGPNLIYSIFVYQYSIKKVDLIKNQKKFFYLSENQGWENIFCYVVSKQSNNQVYAVPHSTIRFWDLRHFSSISHKNTRYDIKNSAYLVNSSFAKDEYIRNGFEKTKLNDCEALRYQNKVFLKNECKEGLLVLLDYSKEYTKDMMVFLQKYENLNPGKIHYIFKSHVNSPINLDNYEFKYAEIFDGNISDALNTYRICFCSNMTSAQVDAYTFGLKVLVFSDGKNLNLSPLMNSKEIHFISSLNDLKKNLKNDSLIVKSPKNYFYKNKNLEKWSAILFDKV